MRQPVRLECHTNANKFFSLQQIAVSGGVLVQTGNGAIGATPAIRYLNPMDANKKPIPVTQADADQLFDAKVSSKVREHYEIKTGAPVAATTQPVNGKRQINLGLQMLREIVATEVGFYMKSSAWLMMEKMNGNRRGIVATLTGVRTNTPIVSSVIGVTKLEQEVQVEQALADAIVAGMKHIGITSIQLDGEMMGDVLRIWDVMEYSGVDCRSKPFEERHQLAAGFVYACNQNADAPIKLVRAYKSHADKTKEFNRVKEVGGEGVVFRLASSPYKAGRPGKGGDALKYKFWHDGDFIIGPGVKGKRSVGLFLKNVVTGKLEFFGTCKVHDNYDMPVMDFTRVAKVRYLYLVYGAVQPQYEGERNDKRVSECTWSPDKAHDHLAQQVFYRDNKRQAPNGAKSSVEDDDDA